MCRTLVRLCTPVRVCTCRSARRCIDRTGAAPDRTYALPAFATAEAARVAMATLSRRKAQTPLRRLPRNFAGRGSFGEVGVMEFGLN